MGQVSTLFLSLSLNYFNSVLWTYPSMKIFKLLKQNCHGLIGYNKYKNMKLNKKYLTNIRS